MRPLNWPIPPSPLPKGHVQTFENNRYLAHLDNDPQFTRDVFVVVIYGKLPGGTRLLRFRDYRDSYSEARALVRKRTGL